MVERIVGGVVMPYRPESRERGNQRELVGWFGVVAVWMARFVFALALAGAVGLGVASLFGACAAGYDRNWDLDLDPPRLVALSGLSIGDPGALLVLSPLDPLQAEFSEPLDAASVDQDHIVLVEGVAGAACRRDADCPSLVQGAASFCVDEVCHASPVGQAFCKDLERVPLSESRWKLVVPAVVQVGMDSTVTVTPLVPLTPNRLYSLAVGPVQDLAGNPVVDGQGRVATLVVHFVTSDPFRSCVPVHLVRPSDGADRVPTNLPLVVLRAEQPLDPGALAGMTLHAAGNTGSVVANWRTCKDEPEGIGACYEGAIAGELAPASRYEVTAAAPQPGQACAVVRAAQNLSGSGSEEDGNGAQTVGFVTASGPDLSPPTIALSPVVQVGPCIEISVDGDEPVTARTTLWRMGGAGQGEPLLSLEQRDEALRHRFLIDVAALGAVGDLDVLAQGLDAVGHEAWAGPVTASMAPTARRVVITEVLSNPAGKEPDQEFVEVLNLEDQPVDLGGWTLSDSVDGQADALPDVTLAPGQYGVIVGDRYDPDGGSDPAPQLGSVLVRCDSSLGSAGLANAGEPVFLRNAEGVIASALAHPIDMSSSKDNGCSVERTAAAACPQDPVWAPNRDGTSTPGGPNSWW